MRKVQITLLAIIALGALSFKSSAQCSTSSTPDQCTDCVTISLPSSVTTCVGVPYVFNPAPYISVPTGFVVESYTWTPTGVTPSSGLGMPPTTSILPVLGVSAPPCGIVSNPYTLKLTGLAQQIIPTPYSTFSGSPSICNDYTYTTTITGPPQYTITNDAFGILGNAVHFYDHTTGTSSGDMLYCDGDANRNVIYKYKLPVCPGSEYKLSFAMATINVSASFPDLYLHVEDATGTFTTYGPFNNSSVFDNWDVFAVSWLNPAAASYNTATIWITGNSSPTAVWSPLTWGTVFTIDDVEFRRRCTAAGRMNVDVRNSTISGPTSVCMGSTIALTGCTPGGSWSSSNTSVATIDASGVVTGINPGTTTITFVDAYGCTATYVVTVLGPLPIISGPSHICQGSPFTCTTTSGAGTWGASGSLYMTAGWGLSTSASFMTYGAGSATVTLTDPTTGCTGTHTVTIDPTPCYMPVSHICIGYSFYMTNCLTGGAWSSSNPGVATIDASTGFVVGLSVGSTVITYTMPGTGCSRTTVIYVYDCAGGSGMVGASVLCDGTSTTYIVAAGIPTGGTWSSSNTAVGVIDPATGVFTTVGPGVTVVTYTVGSTTYSITVTVLATATACVTTGYSSSVPGYYYFTFTSTCATTATIIYRVYSFTWGYLGTGTTTAGVINYSTIAATYGGAAYWVCVVGVYCNGCFTPSSCCASVNPGPRPANESAETEAENNELLFNVSPNPNNGQFTIMGNIPSNAVSKDAQIEVIDMLGKVIYTEKVGTDNGIIHYTLTLNENIPSGTYIVKLKNDEQSKVTRITINR